MRKARASGARRPLVRADEGEATRIRRERAERRGRQATREEQRVHGAVGSVRDEVTLPDPVFRESFHRSVHRPRLSPTIDPQPSCLEMT